jgi:DNA-binding CsgD family transcriptional regulator
MIANGHTSPQIAEEMCLSLPTIKWYRKKIRAKFDAETTIETIRKALEQGLI